jgi:hypothetical protein
MKLNAILTWMKLKDAYSLKEHLMHFPPPSVCSSSTQSSLQTLDKGILVNGRREKTSGSYIGL